MKRLFLKHALIWALCAVGIVAALRLGHGLPAPEVGLAPAAPVPAAAPISVAAPGAFASILQENLGSALGRLLLQLIVIIVATRAAGALFRRGGFPAVVGEIAAGILLGPSLLGWLWPGGFGFVFASGSLATLGLFSQIGVAVFMFVVGMDLEAGEARSQASAVLISQTGLIVPYLFGTVSALFLYSRYASPGAPFVPFALFLGISMSITAFPVLVRILRDRKMAQSPLGRIAITCAAAGDASAWAVLALVVALVRAQGIGTTLFNFGLLAGFVVLMTAGVRRWLPRWLGVDGPEAGIPSTGALAAVLLVMAGSALVTECLGIHALFGAFLAGTVMPRERAFREYLIVRLESFTSILLLPLFFAFSGLRTHLGLLQGSASWLVCLAIVLVATAGKLGSGLFSARWHGMDWPDAFSFGALMNTRGLMELIALNLGYDLGILPPRIFTMLVLMALATTFLTGPLLNLGERFKRRAARFPSR